jgi:hypothetical protein
MTLSSDEWRFWENVFVAHISRPVDPEVDLEKKVEGAANVADLAVEARRKRARKKNPSVVSE